MEGLDELDLELIGDIGDLANGGLGSGRFDAGPQDAAEGAAATGGSDEAAVDDSAQPETATLEGSIQAKASDSAEIKVESSAAAGAESGGEATVAAAAEAEAAYHALPPEGTFEVEDIDLLPQSGTHIKWTALPALGAHQPYELATVVQFSARGAQDVIVALSPNRRPDPPIYEFRIGDEGNLKTVLRKKMHAIPVASAYSMPCSRQQFVDYWIVVKKGGEVSMGIGTSPGKDTILKYQDPNGDAKDLLVRSNQCHFQDREDGATDDPQVSKKGRGFQDSENAPVEQRYISFTCLKHVATFKNIVLRAVAPEDVEVEDSTHPFRRVPGSDEGFSATDKDLLSKAIERYERECDSRRKRAQRFGQPYTVPDIQDVLPWSLLKRLTSHAKLPGGIDPTLTEERERAAKRAARFDLPQALPPQPLLPDIVEEEDKGRRDKRAARFGITTDFSLVAALRDQGLRFQGAARFGTTVDFNFSLIVALKQQGLSLEDVLHEDPDRADPLSPDADSAMTERGMYGAADEPEPVRAIPDKLHVFSLDKFTCKKMRQRDVQAYFGTHGARYVEWINDWSFNVVFPSERDAGNALEECSSTEAEDTDADPGNGAEEAGAGAGEGDEADLGGKGDVKAMEVDDVKLLDLAALGWRLGRIMRKVSSDKFGAKGEWVRILLRHATTADVLLERPVTPLAPQGPSARREGPYKPVALQQSTERRAERGGRGGEGGGRGGEGRGQREEGGGGGEQAGGGRGREKRRRDWDEDDGESQQQQQRYEGKREFKRGRGGDGGGGREKRRREWDDEDVGQQQQQQQQRFEGKREFKRGRSNADAIYAPGKKAALNASTATLSVRVTALKAASSAAPPGLGVEHLLKTPIARPTRNPPSSCGNSGKASSNLHVAHVPAALPGDPQILKAALKDGSSLHLPGEEGYETARQHGTWQLDPVVFGYPSAIVSATCAEDVAASIKYALENKVKFSVAGGRHTYLCILNDRLLIDLSSHMNKVTVDAAAKMATAQGGSLVGSRGYLERVYGMGIDNVVLASGEIVTASEEENADLFWAIRGGGSNFGIVTEVTYQLHELPNGGNLLSGARVHLPLNFFGKPDRYKLLLDYAERAKTAPNEFSSDYMIIGGGRTSPIIEVDAWVGEPSDGEKYFAEKVKTIGKPVADSTGVRGYHKGVQRLLLGPGEKQGGPAASIVKVLPLEELTPEMCRVIADRYTAPFPKGVGGKSNEKPVDSTACPDRSSTIMVVVIVGWKPANDLTARTAAKQVKKKYDPDHWFDIAYDPIETDDKPAADSETVPETTPAAAPDFES
ncbi:hypothetical protein JKP88DRAFT_288468 [Tribonema minus]|uniref:FAD-binding PCMH-type domain-containing protein n=1 Tax=Tribonema minus TaxID=303371 RepID=A0A835Z5S9_9STRA|nr:hypothetical protein JKP88DRAFT_288468 [Tribonema minus]